MAKHVEVKISDDLGGVGAAETVTLSLNGRKVEIDLSKRNRETLERHLEKYFLAGREETSSRPSTVRNYCDVKRIRDWASKNGIELPSRGRIPKAVVSQYEAAKS